MPAILLGQQPKFQRKHKPPLWKELLWNEYHHLSGHLTTLGHIIQEARGNGFWYGENTFLQYCQIADANERAVHNNDL